MNQTGAQFKWGGRQWALAALAALPALAALIYALRFRLGLPYWDGWELVPDVQKLYAGTLTLADLWRPHNEHRLFLPRLILLGLARLTRWNDGYEVALSLAAAAGTAALLIAQWRRTAAQLRLPGAGRLIPLLTLLVFALTQWENWLWGWQFIFYLETLLAVAAVLLLTQAAGDSRWRWPHLAGAAALAVAASFTLSLGLLTWPVGLALLLLAGWAAHVPARRLAGAGALWALLGVAVFWLYFSGLAAPTAGGLRLALGQPLTYAHYVLNYLGAAVLTYDFAFLAGGLGLAAWVWAVVLLARCYAAERAGFAALLPWVALGLWAISGALLIGASRLALGPHQAIASRYVTLSYPFWVSLCALLFVVAAPPARRAAEAWQRAVVNVGLMGLAALVLVCSVGGGLLGYYWRYRAVQPARAAALAGASLTDEALRAIYPNPEVVRPWLEYLRAERLSLFAAGAPSH